ncbi:PREDICTED: uncharacterized protein LOC109335214 [Lupinus angustifolius]|uniref:uncharacterized protein LOC109335214 n=1 Tax=Lupinus angustifolius TaxID=3871 RepID=UPI00092F2DD5|nr:PREDICTED: uncharacterized protein LOC109335214 [Lupinus angustifolius]
MPYNPNTNQYPSQHNNTPHPSQNIFHHNVNVKKTPQFDPIPVTYAEIFAYLMAGGFITPIVGKVPESPGPWFNPNVTCAYHSRVIGHSIEHCRALKYKVQQLINTKQLVFEENTPDVDRNPLPNHGNQGVNVVEDAPYGLYIWEVHGIKTPMKVIYQEMCRHGMVEKLREDEDPDSCEIHGPEGHTLEDCPEFKKLMQKMLDMRLITIERGPKCQSVNNVTPGEGDMSPTWRPSITRFVPNENTTDTSEQPSYVTYVARVSRVTRSGHVYGAPDIEKNSVNTSKGKDKQSEYKVVDQLSCTPSRISILALLIGSEAHRNVLLKGLNQAHVSHDITIDKLNGIINNIVADNYISFSEQEIPAEGIGHTSLLHISIMYRDCLIGKVLIDNGSSLNVMSKRTFFRLPLDSSYIMPSSMIVRAFDGSKSDVMGEIELPI